MHTSGREPLHTGFPKFTFSVSFIRDLRGWEGQGDAGPHIFCENMFGKLFFSCVLEERRI